MLDYSTLTVAHLAELRAQRLTELEVEHYRLTLRRAEGDPVAEQCEELERRILLYRRPEGPALNGAPERVPERVEVAAP